jgi:translation initiation factor 6 (eIF-6)
VLDLIITSSPDRVEVLDIISPNDAGIFTDHAILQFEIKIKTEKAKTSRSFVFDYHNTDFNALRNAIKTENLSAVIHPTSDINKNWSNWITAFNSLIKKKEPTLDHW